MKRTLLALMLGISLASPVFGQSPGSTTPPPPPDGPSPGGHHGGLTPDEMKELHTDHDAALKANPALAQQEQSLHDQMKALQKQIDAAMIQIDPNVAPIIAKMEKGHGHHDGAGGPGGPPPPGN